MIPAQKICGEKVRGTDYIADFVYWTKDDLFICEDAKGHKTAEIANLLGIDAASINATYDEVIHRDNLVILR